MTDGLSSPDGHFARGLSRLLHWLGIRVARHSWKIIGFCVLLTFVCTLKAASTRKQSDLLAYAPPNARSRVEHAAYQEFFGRYGQGVMTYVLIEATDNQTMLRPPHLNETVKVLDHISRNFKIYNQELKRNQSFDEFCSGFCQLNEPVRQFYNGFVIQEAQVRNQSPLNSRIRLNYPTSSLFGRQFTIQANFFGVDRYSEEELKAIRETNRTTFTNMKTVRMIVFQFRADKDLSWTDDGVAEYEMSIANYFVNQFASENIRVLVISPSYVAKEIERGGMLLQPLLVVGFATMCVFTILTTIMSSTFVDQFTSYKIILAVAACVVPLLSCVTAFGLAFFCGVRFSPLIAITPFLILAIGVDDAYLLNHAWHRAVQKTRKLQDPTSNPTELRIAMVCAEAGPSIFLSSTTNILAFLIGATMSTPEIQLFSIVNASAIFVDTIYSITFYPAVMALFDRAEIRRDSQVDSGFKRSTADRLEKIRGSVNRWLDEYVRLLTTPFVAYVVVACLFFYLATTGWGAMQMEIDLRSEKFFLRNSRVLEADSLKQKFVVPAFTAPVFIVNRPGNLSDALRLSRLEKLVEHLEHLPDAIGRDSTKYFVRDFKDYLAAFAESEEEQPRGFNPDDLESFLAWPEFSFLRGFVRLSNDSNRPGHVQVEKFFFTTGYSGQDLRRWTRRQTLLDEWRKAVDQFNEFNVTVYYEDALFLDLIDVIPASTWQSALSTLFCITAVCFLFVGNLFTTVLATLSVFSICLGQFGILYFCGFTLDPILGAAQILTIGLSIDIPAHFLYHYHRTGNELEKNADIRNRLKTTLSSVGFPVFQAGISTILCVLTLLLVPLYMGLVFVLSLSLCISLSLVHALFIIPALLTFCSQLKSMMTRRSGVSPAGEKEDTKF